MLLASGLRYESWEDFSLPVLFFLRAGHGFSLQNSIRELKALGSDFLQSFFNTRGLKEANQNLFRLSTEVDVQNLTELG